MINLTKKPFYLSEEDIKWVENTKKNMTTEEKIGQLFVPIGYSGDPGYLEHVMLSHHIGGIMYRCGDAEYTSLFTGTQQNSTFDRSQFRGWWLRYCSGRNTIWKADAGCSNRRCDRCVQAWKSKL